MSLAAGQTGEVIVRLSEGGKLIGIRRLTYVNDTSRDGMHQISLSLLNIHGELLTSAGVSACKLDEAVNKVFTTDEQLAQPHTYELLFSRFINGKSE